MIQANSISFEYPGVQALNNVSISAEKGDIVALVGPNGAGKTTLLRCLAALAHPAGGQIIINGIDTQTGPRQCHSITGYLRDTFGLYDNLTARQCLMYAAAARGISSAQVPAAVKKSAEALQIDNCMDAKAGTLSRGLRQRLAIAQSIIHEPKVLLLDEPASGLDPEARYSLSKLFKNLSSRGMTLVVSSHILTELEEYSTAMLIIDKGKVVSFKRLGLQSRQALSTLKITLVRPFDGIKELLGAMDFISDIDVQGHDIYLSCPSGSESGHALLKRLIEAGAPVCGITELKENMQDEYIKRLGRVRRGENGA